MSAAATRYIATVRVVIDSDSPEHYRDRDVRCVADRFVSAGGLAYDLAHARVVSVSLDGIQEVPASRRGGRA
jgi:hypothetical protein